MDSALLAFAAVGAVFLTAFVMTLYYEHKKRSMCIPPTNMDGFLLIYIILASVGIAFHIVASHKAKHGK